MAPGKVAHYSRKPLQFPVFVFQGRRKDIRPKSRPVFPAMPIFVSEVAFGRGSL
jgi:hypothetical protein